MFCQDRGWHYHQLHRGGAHEHRAQVPESSHSVSYWFLSSPQQITFSLYLSRRPSSLSSAPRKCHNHLDLHLDRHLDLHLYLHLHLHPQDRWGDWGLDRWRRLFHGQLEVETTSEAETADFKFRNADCSFAVGAGGTCAQVICDLSSLSRILLFSYWQFRGYKR